MARLDPAKLFLRIAGDIPPPLLGSVFVTGSLAAAYAFKVKLKSRAVNTKDADLVVHPAGNVASAVSMAMELLRSGWRRLEGKCFAREKPEPVEELMAIRLNPPGSTDYFVEFLNVPREEQADVKRWVPVKLDDGWYGLPSFRFMGVTEQGVRLSDEGLRYAAPEMMALSNLLSHSPLGDDRIESGEFTGIHRGAKDLGRVLALAYLSGRDATEEWVGPWRAGLVKSFPRTWRAHARRAGAGLRELLDDEDLLEEARKTTEAGLLGGMGVGVAALRGVGERLLVDAIGPLEGS
jgi:hypothetical protein